MERLSLEVEARQIENKQNLKLLRKEGKIPAVFYGHGEKTTHLVVNGKAFDKLIHTGLGKNALIDINIGGKNKTCIVKEIQRNIFTHNPIHIDLLAVSMKQKIEVNVPLHVVGTAPGVKNSGGILEHILRELRVKCLPGDIPKSIDVDVSKLEITQSLAVKDLTIPQGVEVLADSQSMVVNVVAPTKIEEVTPEAEAAAAGELPQEPEVIGKGKKEKEGEEGAEGAAPASEAGKAAAKPKEAAKGKKE
ncbi:MAG: 50S ribosomal protein L25 [Endomicrobiales bacterium]|nr:50S ribosomal protein L25 [Endomicrobiales bacterium]